MAEILPGIHQVEGAHPSEELPSNVYLVKDAGESYTLIDTGVPGTDAAIGAYLKKVGIEPHRVRNVLVTHLHNDHVGSLRKVKELTGAKLHAHWLEAAFIAMEPKYDGPGMPPVEPVKVDAKFKDGDALDVGGGLVAYHTPGHTPGHTAFYHPGRRVLFSGDLFFGIPALTLTTPQYTLHTLSAQVSARRMADLGPESILCHHGGPFPKGAAAELRGLVAKF